MRINIMAAWAEVATAKRSIYFDLGGEFNLADHELKQLTCVYTRCGIGFDNRAS